MSPSGGQHTLVLIGELDRFSAHTLEAEIERLCEAGTSAITLDLSGLTHIDPIGVAVVAFRAHLCERHGYGFALVRGARHVQREFELAGLDDRLPFEGREPSTAAGAQMPVLPAAPALGELPASPPPTLRTQWRAPSRAPRRSFSFMRIWQSQKGSARP
jgi:anti-anti-sigma factor